MHTQIRWLTIVPAANRAKELLAALKKYFLEYLSRSGANTVEKVKYLDIVEYLQNPLLDTYLSFVKSTAEIFTTNFTVLMQRDEPLIHILHFQLNKIINLLLHIIVKPEAID